MVGELLTPSVRPIVYSTLLCLLSGGISVLIGGLKVVKWYCLSWGFFGLFVAISLVMKVPFDNTLFYVPAIILEHVLLAFLLASLVKDKKENLVVEQCAHQAAENNLCDLKKKLENLVSLRTNKLDDANQKPSQIISTLKITQNELIEIEKMAEIGKLVSKVASLTEKPVKQCFGLTTRISLALLNFEKLYKQKALTKAAMRNLIYLINGYIPKLSINLKESSELNQTFKNIAVVEGVDELTSFSLLTYINSLVTSLYSSDSKTDINVLNKEDVKLDSYPSLIYQIITRLVENSKQHAFENVASPQIHILIEKTTNGICLSLKDNGKGIPQSELESIFEAFYTLDKSHPINGLGLHIVKNLVVHRLKGKIHCESGEGEGLNVIIELPLKIKENQAA